jgi:hypothetical protein
MPCEPWGVKEGKGDKGDVDVEPIRLSALGACKGPPKRPAGRFCRFSAAPAACRSDATVPFGLPDAKSSALPGGLDARTWRGARARARHPQPPTARPWGGGRRERPPPRRGRSPCWISPWRSPTATTPSPRRRRKLDPCFRTAPIRAARPSFHGSGCRREPSPSSSAAGAHSRREEVRQRTGRRPIEGREGGCAAASDTRRFAASPPATPGGELRRPHMEREVRLRWEARWRWEGGEAGRGSSARSRWAARWSRRSSPGPAEHARLLPCRRGRWRLGKEREWRGRGEEKRV